MTEPYIGEIQLFGFNYAPKDWATCSGQIMPVRQNTALFSLIGAYYGGDGRATFGLPNFGASAANNQGQGPGLSLYNIGELSGSAQTTVLEAQMPSHFHTAQIYMARGAVARVGVPTPGAAPSNPSGSQAFVVEGGPDTTMSSSTLNVTGGSQPHPNEQPYLTLNYSIALVGTFPSFG